MPESFFIQAYNFIKKETLSQVFPVFFEKFPRTSFSQNISGRLLLCLTIMSYFILAFIALLDNYESSTGVAETVTVAEERENWNFINSIFETEVIKFTHNFLVRKGKVSQDVGEFKKQFYDMWFKLYRKETSSKYVLSDCSFRNTGYYVI